MGNTLFYGLEKLMIEENIKIIKGKEVKKLISINKKITSVELEDGTQLKANNVVCNADPPAVYSNLINEKFNTIFKWKMKRMEYSMGLFVYYFGTKKKYENVAHHTICFGKSYKEHLHKIFSKKILSVAQYATKLGYDSLSAEQIFELDQAIFRESKIFLLTPNFFSILKNFFIKFFNKLFQVFAHIIFRF